MVVSGQQAGDTEEATAPVEMCGRVEGEDGGGECCCCGGGGVFGGGGGKDGAGGGGADFCGKMGDVSVEFLGERGR